MRLSSMLSLIHILCDSSELTIQKALKTAVETASAARGERIGVIGGSGDTAAQLVTRAEAINSERMVLVGPDMKDESGKALSGVFAAAAVAGAIAVSYTHLDVYKRQGARSRHG